MIRERNGDGWQSACASKHKHITHAADAGAFPDRGAPRFAFMGVLGTLFAVGLCGLTGLIECLLCSINGVGVQNGMLIRIDAIIPSLSPVGRQPVARMTIGAP